MMLCKRYINGENLLERPGDNHKRRYFNVSNVSSLIVPTKRIEILQTLTLSVINVFVESFYSLLFIDLGQYCSFSVFMLLTYYCKKAVKYFH